MLTHLSLFTGIGGLDLAAEWAGLETVGQCEWADYPTRVLKRHWPDVPRWRDIKTLTGGDFFAKTGLTTVDVISGGFPCQPHSVIGQRRGADDDRHLWPEFLRVVSELRPRWVVGENVIGILSTIHESVCAGLEAEGYEVRTYCIPAVAVGAPHERYRVAIIGVSKSQPRLQANPRVSPNRAGEAAWETTMCQPRRDTPRTYWSTHQSPVCGLDDGFPHRLEPRYKERMMALGNAVVPQQFYPIYKAIVDIEVMAIELQRLQ